MAEIDYNQKRGIADEVHWNRFVLTVGGELVGPHIKSQGVKNADYIFPAAKVIAELKILQTEFAHTKETLQKVDVLIERYPGVNPDDATKPLRRELLLLLRKPLQRIINNANRQIVQRTAYATHFFLQVFRIEAGDAGGRLCLTIHHIKPRLGDGGAHFNNALRG